MGRAIGPEFGEGLIDAANNLQMVWRLSALPPERVREDGATGRVDSRFI